MGDYEESSLLSDREKCVLRLSDAMTDTPATVSEDLFDELRSHFAERELVEVTSAIAWENYRARFNRVFDVHSEAFSKGAFCPLPVN